MRRVARAGHRVQSLLGDHRDAQLLSTRVERERVRAGRAGEDTLIYEELEEVARDTAARRLDKLPKAQKKLQIAVEAIDD